MSHKNPLTNDVQAVPNVAIVVPQQPATQQLQQQTLQSNAAATPTSSSTLLSPVESPRHSIILQPLANETLQQQAAFVLGQVS